MGTMARLALIGLFGGVALGCKDDGTGPTLADIVDTWTVTKADVTSVANPATKTELVALGLTGSLVLNANQTFILTSTTPGDPPDVGTGTYVYTAGQLTLNITSEVPAEVLAFGLSLSGNTMRLTGGSISFDFGSGEVSATLDLTLTR